MAKCYKLNPSIFNDAEALNNLEPLGFGIEGTGDGAFKLVKIERQDLSSPIVTGSLYNIYCNKQWIDTHYKRNKPLMRKVLGLRYNMDGKPTMSERFKSVLCDWRLEITDPFGDGLLSVHSGDPFEAYNYINASNIEQIAKYTLQEMIDLDYVILEDIKDNER